MTLRPVLAVLTLAAGLAGGSVAQAEIVVGGSSFPDADRRAIEEACRGLEAQSRMSLTADVPDDLDNGDAAGEYALDQLPFTLRDCRAAGII